MADQANTSTPPQDDEMSLFDASPFTRYGATPRSSRPARGPKPVPTVPILTTDEWRYVTKDHFDVVHAFRKPWRHGGAAQAFCGEIVRPLQLDPGKKVSGCRKCIDRGAHFTATPSRGGER